MIKINDFNSEKLQRSNAMLFDSMRGGFSRKIAVPGRSGLIYYNPDDIVYIEADGSYAIMHLSTLKPVTVSRKVKDFESSLADKGFLRVHKSYLANINHIAELHRDDSGYLIMSNQARIPISPKDKEQVIESIKQFCTII